jgi:hypothetical protein
MSGYGELPGLLRETSVEVIGHLGANAFHEGPQGFDYGIALFTLRSAPATPDHQIRALRLIGSRTPEEKAELMVTTCRGRSEYLHQTKQTALLAILGTPVSYSAHPLLLDLLAVNPKLESISLAWDGISTTENSQFLRLSWEVDISDRRWRPYAKGGDTRRWSGLNQWRIFWDSNGERLKIFLEEVKGHAHWSRQIRSAARQFVTLGLTYSLIGGGKLGIRLLLKGVGWDSASLTIAPETRYLFSLLAYLNSWLASAFARTLSPELKFRGGYISRIPIPNLRDIELDSTLAKLGRFAFALTEERDRFDPLEDFFRDILDLRSFLPKATTNAHESLIALRIACEGLVEDVSGAVLRLGLESLVSILKELGAPPGWHLLITGYDTLPELPPGPPTIPQELSDYLISHERISPSPQGLARIKNRLRALYIAEPRARVEEEENEATGDGDSNDDEE